MMREDEEEKEEEKGTDEILPDSQLLSVFTLLPTSSWFSSLLPIKLVIKVVFPVEENETEKNEVKFFLLLLPTLLFPLF